jgi:chemotaxis protein methyltransferase CheR
MKQVIDADQVDELLEILLQVHGYDFSAYARASFRRRIRFVLDKYRLDMFSLKQRLVNEAAFFRRFLDEVTVNVTEMFRDPSFYKAVREQVFPLLDSYPSLRVWNAGCSSGEETYSFAILLKEAGLYDKSFLYGTDISAQVLEKARDGIYELAQLKAYSGNYLNAGGTRSLSQYYHAAYDAGIMDESLKKHAMFSVHNLVMDKSFNEFQMVVCRNVLIYFNEELQQKVLQLLYESLCPFGFLCLGSRETIRSTQMQEQFRIVNRKEHIYQRIG